MRLAKVITKIYNPNQTIDYTLKYLRSSKRIYFKSLKDCFDLDEILIVGNSLLIVALLEEYYDTKNSVYLPERKLCIMKTYYDEN